MYTSVEVVGFASVSTMVGLNIGWLWVMFMVFTATFNNMFAIPWRSVLLVDETAENYRPSASHWQALSHKSCFDYTSPWADFELTNLVVISTDCIGSFKSNYLAIKTAPWIFRLRSIFCFSFDAYPGHVCFKHRLVWHGAIRCFLHTVYYDITISCLFCIPFIIIQSHTVCFTYRLLWHNQMLSFIYCHLCLQYHYQLYIHIHHCPGMYLLQEYLVKLIHH